MTLILLIVYVIGAIVAGYILGRLEDAEALLQDGSTHFWILFWPVLLVILLVAIVVVGMKAIVEFPVKLGSKHRDRRLGKTK